MISALAAYNRRIMGEAFALGFEQVELVNGLSENVPVWLYLRATVYNANDLDHPLAVEEIGSFPPDANRAVDDSFPKGDAGIYASHLTVAQPIRNDGEWGAPRFQLSSVWMEPGQVLEVLVVMLPKVWFHTHKVSKSEADRAALSVFSGLVAASGFGVIGGLVVSVISWLTGSSDDEVEVPCFQSIITARHVFSFDDLLGIEAEPMRRFGPRDNDASLVCGEIDSYYWLSVNHFPDYPSFGPAKPFKPGDCELHPHANFPPPSWLAGNWGDTPDPATACLRVNVGMTEEWRASVYVSHGALGLNPQPRVFDGRRIALGIPKPPFVRNIYDDACPARSVAPACKQCGRFTNLPKTMRFAKEMLALAVLGGAHVGASRWITADNLVRVATNDSCPPTLPHQSIKRDAYIERRAEEREFLEARPLIRGHLMRGLPDGRIEIWPSHTPPMSTRGGPSPLVERLEVIDRDSPFLALFSAFVIELSDREVLYSYAEFGDGEPRCPRLRYVKRSAAGEVVADVLLEMYPAQPR